MEFVGDIGFKWLIIIVYRKECCFSFYYTTRFMNYEFDSMSFCVSKRLS